MKDIPYQKIIHAAGMGLTRSQTMELLGVTPHHLRKAIDKYGLTFALGYNHPLKDKSQAKPPAKRKNKNDPYFSISKEDRKAAYKKLMSKAKTASKQVEIAYGYCLYEFELGNYKDKKRGVLPCRTFDDGFSRKEKAARAQQDRKTEKVEDILRIVSRLGTATSGQVSEFTDISQKSVTTYMQRMFMNDLLERTVTITGKNRTRSWNYSIKQKSEKE